MRRLESAIRHDPNLHPRRLSARACPERRLPRPAGPRPSRILRHAAGHRGRRSSTASRDAEVALNIRSSSRFTERVFAACPKLRLVSIWGTGTDHVDLAAAARHGVAIANTPGVSARSIAEHTLALLFAVARRIPQMDAATRRGAWERGQSMELYGKTCGVDRLWRRRPRIRAPRVGHRHARDRLDDASRVATRAWNSSSSTNSTAPATWSASTCACPPTRENFIARPQFALMKPRSHPDQHCARSHRQRSRAARRARRRSARRRRP